MDAERTPPAGWRFDRFTLNLARGALLGPDGAEVPLRPKSLALLRFLVENPGRLLDRDAIMAAVWPGVVVTDQSISQCVRDIRKALGDETLQVLRTVPKRGFLLAAEVTPAESNPPLPRVARRLAAILAADVAGFSRLMHVDEIGTLGRLTAHRNELIEPLITEHRGRVVKLMGDGALCEFASVVDAVACAVAIQGGMAEREADLPEMERIRFRIGINLGDIIYEADGDIYGDGVNIAARLEALSPPGGIAVSAAAREQAANHGNLRFVDLGEQLVKVGDRPLHAFTIDLPFVTACARAPAAVPSRPMIAVLPFDNLNSGADTSYFADGITEDLITELSRFRSLLVIDRNSSFAYRGHHAPIAVVGQELGVGFALCGSVRRSGDRIRIHATLVDTASKGQVWGQKYDRLLGDVFEVQDDVVQAIVGTITRRLDDAATRAARRKIPENLTAYDLVLRGSELMHLHTHGNNLAARELFRRASALDADYVLAHVRLAQTFLFEFFWDNSGQSLRQAFEIAKHAMQIDDSESWSHMVLAIAYVHLRDFDRCEHHLRRALELNPNDATIAAKAALLLVDLGQPELALESIERARCLDPQRDQRYISYRGLALFSAQRFAEAVAALEMVDDIHFYHHIWMAASHWHLGHYDIAKIHTRQALELEPGLTITRFKQREPYRNEADLDRWIVALRGVGLPE